jgi:hypothetical protein
VTPTSALNPYFFDHETAPPADAERADALAVIAALLRQKDRPAAPEPT